MDPIPYQLSFIANFQALLEQDVLGVLLQVV